jgi:hypothetical protein
MESNGRDERGGWFSGEGVWGDGDGDGGDGAG